MNINWPIWIYGFVLALIGGSILTHLFGALCTLGVALMCVGYVLIHAGSD